MMDKTLQICVIKTSSPTCTFCNFPLNEHVREGIEVAKKKRVHFGRNAILSTN